MSFALLYVTHPSKPEADTLSVGPLNAKLIACANFFPIESIYHSEGSVVRVQEVVTLYKTSLDKVDQVRSYIEAHHKYQIPCIMKVSEVSANIGYEKWIEEQLHL